MSGMLVAFEGLDQSGKETQAQQLRERLREAGHKVRLLSFPDYGTSIGEEIARALQGEREYGADVMQGLVRSPAERCASCDEVGRALRPLAHAAGMDAASVRALLVGLSLPRGDSIRGGERPTTQPLVPSPGRGAWRWWFVPSRSVTPDWFKKSPAAGVCSSPIFLILVRPPFG